MRQKSLLKTILIALAALMAIFLTVVAFQPSHFRVARSILVDASPAAVFPHVNQLKNWEAWNPWGKVDPEMKLTYDGPAGGVGASYAWVGNQDVGEGRATITESRTNELVRLKLEFFKPMAGVSTVSFSFKPRGNQTEVTWLMTGDNNYLAKALCLFMNMDKMIGGQFEKGLAALKAAAETAQ
jgi:hypothetical protein